MKKLLLLFVLTSFFLSSCNTTGVPQYYLESISILEIPNFAQDANENGINANPDLYIELVDEAGTVLANTPYLLNADSADYPVSLVFDDLYLLRNENYYVDVYDFDEAQHGDPEFLGSVMFVGKTSTVTKYAQYNDTQLSGTLGVTIDVFIEYPD